MRVAMESLNVKIIHSMHTAEQNSSATRQKFFEYALITGICILHILYFLLSIRRGEPSLGVDGEVYRDLAQAYRASESLFGERARNIFWTPWYVVLAAVGAHRVGVFILQLTAFGLTLLAIRALTRLLGMPPLLRIAAIAGYGLYWPTFDYVVFYQYENFLGFVLASTAVLFAASREELERSWWRWLAAGAVGGIGVFAHTKAAGVIWPAILAMLIIARAWRALVRALLVYVPLLVAPTLWWAWRNYKLFGKWVLGSTSIGYNLFVGFNSVATGMYLPQPPPPPADQALGVALRFISEHPWRSLELFVIKLIRFWEISPTDQFGPTWLIWQEWILMPLGLCGFVYAFIYLLRRIREVGLQNWSSGEVALANCILLVAYYVLFHAVFYNTLPRFRLPAMPLIIVLGMWLLSCAEWRRSEKQPKARETSQRTES